MFLWKWRTFMRPRRENWSHCPTLCHMLQMLAVLPDGREAAEMFVQHTSQSSRPISETVTQFKATRAIGIQNQGRWQQASSLAYPSRE